MSQAITDFTPVQLRIPLTTWENLTRAQKDAINCSNKRCFPWSMECQIEHHRPVFYPNGDYYYEGERDAVNKVIAQL